MNGKFLKYPARFKHRQHCKGVWRKCAKKYGYNPDIPTENDDDEEEKEEDEDEEQVEVQQQEHVVAEHEEQGDNDQEGGEEQDMMGEGQSPGWEADDEGEIKALDKKG